MESFQNKSPEEITSFTDFLNKSNPELTTKVKEYNAQNQQLREKIDVRDAMYKTVIKDHPGISKGAAMALAARYNEPLNEEIKSMSYSLDTIGADIKYGTETARADFEYTMRQHDKQSALDQEIRGYMFDLYKTESGRKYEKEAVKMKYLFEEGDVNSTDPFIRKRAITNGVDRVLAQYAGIPMTRSREQMVQDITNMIDKGYDLGTAISENIIKPIQGKTEYQALVNKQAPMSDAEKMALSHQYDLEKMAFDKQLSDPNYADNVKYSQQVEESIGGRVNLVKALASGQIDGKKFF